MDTKILAYSCQPDFSEMCLNELLAELPGCRSDGWIASGVGRLLVPCGFAEASRRLQEKRPIFLRHIFPLDAVFALTGAPDGCREAWDFCASLARRMEKDAPFSVQVRRFDADDAASEAGELARFFTGYLTERGLVERVAAPEQVVSLVLADGTAYAGLSRAEDNLSAWPGGMRRFARYEGQISRAEFKLLEAMETFSLPLPDNGLALDLGAAPGGWTRVLVDRGMRVVAVDPAVLSPALDRHPEVEHFRGLAQDFAALSDCRFDLIVNDMRMEVAESARLTAEFSERLRPGGFVLMTFKLPQKKRTAAIRSGLSILGRRYHLVGARQLFHNRSEITVVCVKEPVDSPPNPS